MLELKSKFYNDLDPSGQNIRQYYNLPMEFTSFGGWKIKDDVQMLDRTFGKGGFEFYTSDCHAHQVLLIGGSTVWGWGAPGRGATLGGMFYENNHDVTVLARPAYDFFRQYLLYLQYEERIPSYDKVYWFLGTNEFYSLYSQKYGFEHSRDKRINNTMKNFERIYYGNIPIYRYMYNKIKIELYRLVSMNNASIVNLEDEFTIPLNYRELFINFLKKIDKKVVFVIEPTLLSKPYISHDEATILSRLAPNAPSFYKTITTFLQSSCASNGFKVINCSELKLTRETLYWDYCHWSPQVASSIYEVLKHD